MIIINVILLIINFLCFYFIDDLILALLIAVVFDFYLIWFNVKNIKLKNNYKMIKKLDDNKDYKKMIEFTKEVVLRDCFQSKLPINKTVLIIPYLYLDNIEEAREIIIESNKHKAKMGRWLIDLLCYEILVRMDNKEDCTKLYNNLEETKDFYYNEYTIINVNNEKTYNLYRALEVLKTKEFEDEKYKNVINKYKTELPIYKRVLSSVK